MTGIVTTRGTAAGTPDEPRACRGARGSVGCSRDIAVLWCAAAWQRAQRGVAAAASHGLEGVRPTVYVRRG